MNTEKELYEVIEQVCCCEGTPYISYGIRLSAPSCSQIIPDISTDRNKIVILASLFNSSDLAACQFRDAVEDYLAAI